MRLGNAPDFSKAVLEEMYPTVYRFAISVFPSKDDDVVTSPYNSIFSLQCLYEHADCVFPVDNEALQRICEAANANLSRNKPPSGAIETEKDNVLVKVKGSNITEIGTEAKKAKPFDKMNNIVAHLLSNLTSSMRFEGKLNIDLNEITMNLVPYPKMHFLLSSMAPLYTLADSKLLPRNLDQSFKDVLASDHQLITSTPLSGRYVAIGLFLRGDITIGDVSRNIEKMKKDAKMIYWNKEGFKYGLCDVAPVGQQKSILCLANNTSISGIFRNFEKRFETLFKRKVYTHHYTEYMELSKFSEAIETVKTLSSDYMSLENVEEPEMIPRYTPIF